MKQTTITLVASTFALALIVAAGPRPTLASEVGEYRAGMPGLIADADQWNAELSAMLAALPTKPELACSAEYIELVNRGRWITDDLVGTGKLAPRALESAHARAVRGITVAVAGAAQIGAACDGSNLSAGVAAIQQGQTDYHRGIFRVRNFLHGFGRGN